MKTEIILLCVLIILQLWSIIITEKRRINLRNRFNKNRYDLPRIFDDPLNNK